MLILFKDGDDIILFISSNNGWKVWVIYSIIVNFLMCSNFFDELSGLIVVKVYVVVCRFCDYIFFIGIKIVLDLIFCYLVILKVFVFVYFEGGVVREYCYVVSIGLCNEVLFKGVELGIWVCICF